MQGEAGSLDLNVFGWNLISCDIPPPKYRLYSMVRMYLCLFMCVSVYSMSREGRGGTME